MSEKTVFISYRRDATGKLFARSIKEALTHHGYDVFLDVDCIDAGKWAAQILTQVPRRAHFLLLLTPGALDRCADPDDWVRREFLEAVAHGRNIVPVREESVDVAAVQRACPPSVADIFSHQIATIQHSGFAQDISKLIEKYIPPHKAPAEPAAVQPLVGGGTEFDRTIDFESMRKRFCDFMVKQLDEYDEQMNWSDRELTPLEAEVEMESRGAAKPRIVSNLTEAICKDKNSNVFLVVGDPGSGKSVSLRRLARELYAAVSKTGVIPLYVNLREWTGPNEPDDQDIYDFILEYVKLFAGKFGQEFIGRYFYSLLKQGKLFFILDSFDEIPSVLDCADGSTQLRNISRAFDQFCNDLHQCRTVLASRPFRRPVGFRGRRLTIRPFRESQVRQAMTIWLEGTPFKPKEVVHRLFKERPELASAVRNPFTADLIAKYIVQTGGELPATYVAIFDSHLERMLRPWANEHGTELGLTVDTIQTCAASIALHMFRSASGFEITIDQLQAHIDDPALRSNISAMKDVRLIRLGGLTSEKFSFVHRRFAEFFAVRGLLKEPGDVDFESIPTDSRWRDALVVYCSVAPEDTARKIANFCWETIQKHIVQLRHETLEQAKPCIHSLRFVKDAFRSRPECLSEFQRPLSSTVLMSLRRNDLVVNWLGAECIPLIHPDDQPYAIAQAFDKKSSWIADTALRACRHLSVLSRDAHAAIRRYVKSLSMREFRDGYGDLQFSFSLSDAFRGQKRRLSFDFLQLIVLWIAVFGSLIVCGVNVVAGSSNFVVVACGAIACFAIVGEVFNEMTDGYLSQNALPELLGERRPLCSGLRLGALIGIGLLLSGGGFFFFMWPMLSTLVVIAWLLVVVPWDEWQTFVNIAFEIWWLILLAIVGMSVSMSYIWLKENIDFNESSTARILEWVYLIYAALSLCYTLFWISLLTYRASRITSVSLIGRIRDRKTLANFTIRSQPTREWIIGYCRGLGSEGARVRFLTHLRFRQIRVSGSPLPLPNEEWVTIPVREAYIRLELQWQEIPED